MCTTRGFCIEDDNVSTSPVSSSDSLPQSIHGVDHQALPTSSLHSNYSFSDSSSDILGQCVSQHQHHEHRHHQQQKWVRANSNQSVSSYFDNEENKNRYLSSTALSTFLNTFISLVFNNEHYIINYQRQRIKLAVTTFILPIIVLKMNAFFDHIICLLTLVIIRYATSKIWTNENHNNNDSNHDENLLTSENMKMYCSRNTSSPSVSMSSSFASTMYGMLPSYSDHSDSYFIIHEDESLDSSYEETSNNTHSLSITTLSSSPCSLSKLKNSSSSFLPMDQDDTTDEWGHFTDFIDVDQQQQQLQKNCSITLDDPFCSITKSMLRRRGHKLSVCRLEQLKEGEEEEEEEDCF